MALAEGHLPPEGKVLEIKPSSRATIELLYIVLRVSYKSQNALERLYPASIGLRTHSWPNFANRPHSYPNPTSPLFPTNRTWSFAELYLDCTANSQKATRNLKDKMAESQEFAVNFAKLCLLVNVGRINTTIACKWAHCDSAYS